MSKEIETQVLDINPKSIIAKLRKLKAKEYPEILQKRWVYDIDCKKTKGDSSGRWIRLRQSGDCNTITYKNKNGSGISQTDEIEIQVDNFNNAAKILSKIPGFIATYYQENKRKKFILKDVEITLDTWPMIPTYLEVEAKSKMKLDEVLKLLSVKDVGHLGTYAIYKRYGIDAHSYKVLKFGMKR